MTPNIESEKLFRQALLNGLNLFIGSGFSLLAKDMDGLDLPIGPGLKTELCKTFQTPDSLDLSQISNVLKRSNKEEFFLFLERRFCVDAKTIDPYKNIEKLNLKSIFTTNIDDLINKIYDNSKTKYLNDITEKGKVTKSNNSIDYVPLHGSIRNKQRKYVFTPGEIASATHNDQNTWAYLRVLVEKKPNTLLGI